MLISGDRFVLRGRHHMTHLSFYFKASFGDQSSMRDHSRCLANLFMCNLCSDKLLSLLHVYVTIY